MGTKPTPEGTESESGPTPACDGPGSPAERCQVDVCYTVGTYLETTDE